MTKKDLDNCLKIVNYMNNNKNDVISSAYLKNVLNLPEFYLIYLLKEFIIPNKILTNHGTVSTGFALMTNDLTEFLIQDNRLEKFYNEKKADENDKIYKRNWNKYKSITFWPLFIISIFGGIYSGYKLFTDFNNNKTQNTFIDKNEFENKLNKSKLKIQETKKNDTLITKF